MSNDINLHQPGYHQIYSPAFMQFVTDFKQPRVRAACSVENPFATPLRREDLHQLLTIVIPRLASMGLEQIPYGFILPPEVEARAQQNVITAVELDFCDFVERLHVPHGFTDDQFQQEGYLPYGKSIPGNFWVSPIANSALRDTTWFIRAGLFRAETVACLQRCGAYQPYQPLNTELLVFAFQEFYWQIQKPAILLPGTRDNPFTTPVLAHRLSRLFETCGPNFSVDQGAFKVEMYEVCKELTRQFKEVCTFYKSLTFEDTATQLKAYGYTVPSLSTNSTSNLVILANTTEPLAEQHEWNFTMHIVMRFVTAIFTLQQPLFVPLSWAGWALT